MRRNGILARLLSVTLAVGALSLAMVVLSAPNAGASASSSKAVTWAEQPAATPDFILPFYPGSLCSVANVDQFQYLMYRPLYWFGVGTAFKLNTSLSDVYKRQS